MNQDLCPICKKANNCKAEEKNEDCWCFHEEIPKGIFELLPKESIKKQCICKKCVETYKVQQK